MSRPVLLLVLAVLGGQIPLTMQRARVWTSELTLWTDAADKTPQKPRPWINLALAREVAGDVDGALLAHQTALALSFQPRMTEYQQRFSRVASETNIARLLAVTGREQEALRLLNDVLARHPLFPHARWNRGVLLTRMQGCEAGQPDLQMAVALDAGFVNQGCPPSSH